MADEMDWLERAELEEKEWNKKIFVDGRYLSINAEGYPGSYDIELSEIDTPNKLLEWILHLIEKNWVTRDLLVHMIRVLEGHFGHNYYHLNRELITKIDDYAQAVTCLDNLYDETREILTKIKRNIDRETR